MKRNLWVLIAAITLIAWGSSNALSADFNTGLMLGYKGGLSVRATAGISNFAMGFPLSFEAGISYSRVDGGDPFPARRIFIANADNGTPEQYGYTWDFRADFLYNLHVVGPQTLYLFAGMRYSMFDAHFDYVGANEEFDVTSNQWGIGIGGKGVFPMSHHVDLSLTVGIDQYFAGSMHGHDTTYSPDNLNVNAKEDFRYKDAADAVHAPRLQPVAMIGLTYNF